MADSERIQSMSDDSAVDDDISWKDDKSPIAWATSRTSSTLRLLNKDESALAYNGLENLNSSVDYYNSRSSMLKAHPH